MTTITMSCGPDVDDVTSVYASAWWLQTLCTGSFFIILLFAVLVSTLVQYYYNTHAHDAP